MSDLAVTHSVVYTIATAPTPSPTRGRVRVKSFVVLCAATLGAVVATERVAAQPGPGVPAPRTMPVHGVAYDSIRRQPLRDAFVSILGLAGARSTTTDSRGRFRFDSVAPGDYTFAVQHAALDSLGLNGVSRKATVASEQDQVLLGVPSFATLWRIECGGLKLPKDSGFVFGSVHDVSTKQTVAKARVEVSWTELTVKKGHVTGRLWRVETVADDHGNFAVCDVPTFEDLTIRATADSAASGGVELPPTIDRVERRDLAIGPIDSSSYVGLVSGIVTNVSGQPFPEARVAIVGMHETRSDADGRFVVRNVPLGTQQIEVRSVGVSPVSMVIDVVPSDTTYVNLQFGKPIVLQGVHVMATPGVHVRAQEFDVRRHGGTGYMLDSLAIEHYPDFINVFNDMPGIRMMRRPNGVSLTTTNDKGVACVPTILLDGIEVSGNTLSDLLSNEVGGVEVYARPLSVPAELLPPGRPPVCGMVAVWTKYTFRNR